MSSLLGRFRCCCFFSHFQPLGWWRRSKKRALDERLYQTPLVARSVFSIVPTDREPGTGSSFLLSTTLNCLLVYVVCIGVRPPSGGGKGGGDFLAPKKLRNKPLSLEKIAQLKVCMLNSIDSFNVI